MTSVKPELAMTQEQHSAPEIPEDYVDYNKIYEDLQERFNTAYSLSERLFVTEKAQRQTLYFYKRRNQAILDILEELEGDDDISQPLKVDRSRLDKILSLKPSLANTLEPLLQIASGADPSDVVLKPSYPVNLAVDEMIPELPNDELDMVELNPQDTEMWTRRNFSHLVTSKFKPAEIRAKRVYEYVDSPSVSHKRRKRSKDL